MANRYWVGGAGTWDATTTTNWSASSGGAGGASAPTSSDSVIFDTLSNATAYTVTLGTNAVCLDMTVGKPLAGNVTMSLSATAVINCYGSLTLAATGITWTGTSGSKLFFLATSTGKTITSNGVNLGSTYLTLNGVGGGWSLGSAFLSGGTFAITTGTFDTANYNLTIYNFLANAGTKTISLGSSTVTITAAPFGTEWLMTSATTTFNCGTSLITFTNRIYGFNSGGQTYNNISFLTAQNVSTGVSGGAFICNNLTFRKYSALGLGLFVIYNNITVNGTFTIQSGNTDNTYRCMLASDTIGTPRTITAAATAFGNGADFRDITAAGTASPFNLSSVGGGDCGGNTNITFPTTKTVYWVSPASANWSGAVWSTTSGNTGGGTTAFPLAQDSIVIDNAGLTTGNTITLDSPFSIGSLSFANRSNAATFATGSQAPSFYGDYTLSSAITTSGTGVLTFAKQSGIATIKSAGVTLTTSITVNAPLGTVRIDGNLTLGSTLTFTLTSGTLDLTNNGAGNYVLSTGVFSSSNSNTRAITFGAGNITLTGSNTTIWATSTDTNLTVTGAATVNASYSGATGTRTFLNGATTTSSRSISVNVTAGTDIVAMSSFNNINFTGFAGTLSNASGTIYGNLVLNSSMTCATGGNSITFSGVSGTQQITTANNSLDYSINFSGTSTYQLQDNLTTTGATRVITFNTGILDLNNKILTSGFFSSNNTNTRSILFGTGNITLVGSGGIIWGCSNLTGFSYTGTPTVKLAYSGSVGTRSVQNGSTAGTEANSVDFYVTAGTDIYAHGATLCGTLNFTGFAGAFTRPATNMTLYRDLVFSSGMTYTAIGNSIIFAGTVASQQNITSNGITVSSPITFSGTTKYQLQDALTSGSTNTTTLTSGTLDLNGKSLTTGLFSSSNSNTRSILFGTGNITISGSGNAWVTSPSTGFIYTGSPTVNIANNSASAITINTGITTETQALNFNFINGSYSLTDSFAAYKSLNFTGFVGTLLNFTRTIYGDLTFASGMSITAGVSTTTFAATSGTQRITTNGKTLDFPVIQNGIGGTVQLQDALTLGSTRTYALTNGTLQLKSGTTNSLGTFATTGTNVKYLQSSQSGQQATISQSSGTVNVNNLSIRDSKALGGAIWEALLANGNINVANNNGWIFSQSIGFFMLFNMR